MPIANYLNNTINPATSNYLKDEIDYIVLCKGIPLKINSGDHAWVGVWDSYNISVDGLLSLLKTDNNNNPWITKLYPIPPNYTYKCWVSNPYNKIDGGFNFNHRFKANHYTVTKTLNDSTSGEFKIACLVSRLDGRNTEEVLELIDKSYDANKSGEGTWVLDGHYFYSWETIYHTVYNDYNQDTIVATADKLEEYGFNVNSDGDSRSHIYTNQTPVTGYLSWGRHANNPVGFIVDELDFDFMDGSVFNTIESYNGTSMQTAYRVNGQSLLTEFIQIEGTSGVGHTYEPYLGPNNDPYYFFPAYAMGYNIVEAAYQGMQKLAWQNIVIGDPLTTIALGKQTLTANTEWEGTNLVTGKITVPQYKTLTIKEDAVINFKHLGSLEIDGFLMIEKGAKLNFYNGGQLVVNNSIKISGASNKYVEIDFITPNSTTENGIILNDGAFEDSLMYVKIKNAYRGLTVNETAPYINFAEITNCETGIYMYKSDYELTMNVGAKIHNSNFSSTIIGLELNEASPQIINNQFDGNDVELV